MENVKTENPSSAQNEAEALLHLKRIEIRFHVVKLLVIVAASVITSYIVINNVKLDNERTRQQINCVVNGFLQPPQDIQAAVHKCGR